jgi:hypothetical protein
LAAEFSCRAELQSRIARNQTKKLSKVGERNLDCLSHIKEDHRLPNEHETDTATSSKAQSVMQSNCFWPQAPRTLSLSMTRVLFALVSSHSKTGARMLNFLAHPSEREVFFRADNNKTPFGDEDHSTCLLYTLRGKFSKSAQGIAKA